MKRKILPLLLVLCIIFSMVPAVHAADSTPTEASVTAALARLREQYPEGTVWTDETEYAGETYSSSGSLGFAYMLTDTAFNNQGFTGGVSYPSFQHLRPGDVMVLQEIADYYYYVVITEVHEDYALYVQGDYNGTVHWDAVLTQEDLADMLYSSVSTRYISDKRMVSVSLNDPTTGGASPTPDKYFAKPGEVVTISLNTDPGYVLGAMGYTGDIDIVKSPGYLTFVMPDSNVELSLGFDQRIFQDNIDVSIILDGVHTGVSPGHVSFSSLMAAEGNRVEVGVYPTEGYALEDYICFANSYSSSVSDEEMAEMIYSQLDFCSSPESSFIMPCNGTLDFVFFLAPTSGIFDPVTPEPDPEPVNPFTDVEEDRFYYEPVLWAVENEITKGMTDTTFVPGGDCTRGQVVTFLWRAAGSPEPTSQECPFTDVNPDAYYYKAMLWAVEKGITVGTSATEFSPNAPCTRGHVVTFLWRAQGKPAPTTDTCNFTDVNPNAFYYEAMLWAVENQVTSGMTSTTFAPTTTCNRGQVVTFLNRTYE